MSVALQVSPVVVPRVLSADSRVLNIRYTLIQGMLEASVTLSKVGLDTPKCSTQAKPAWRIRFHFDTSFLDGGLAIFFAMR